MVQRLGILILLALSLAACATSSKKVVGQQTPNPHAKVGQPYQVKGVWYVPKPDPDYDKVGLASWYGPGFHGRLTANGEIFDQNRLTAAHPTLPLPSIVEVSNPRNGKRLKLRVNDRGPFANNRILDLSKEAARRLGTEEQGVASVRVRYIGPARLDQAIVKTGQRERGQSLASLPIERNPELQRNNPQLPTEADVILADIGAAAASMPGVPARRAPGPVQNGGGASGYFVQVGAYASAGNASVAASRLPSDVPIQLASARRAGRSLTLVRLGPFLHPFSANEALKAARTYGFPDAMIVEEDIR